MRQDTITQNWWKPRGKDFEMMDERILGHKPSVDIFH